MILGALVVLVAGAVAYAADPFAGPRYQGPRSDHFDGGKFFNAGFSGRRGIREFLLWQLHSEPSRWRRYTDSPYGPPPPRVVEGADLRVTFINHSTTLIQTAGLNILTDPVWSRRVGPVSWFGPRRHRPPGLRIDDLPHIDVVLLSHNHYDHLDVPSLRRIAALHSPQLVVPLGVRALLETQRFGNCIELDWWNAAELPRAMRVTCVPAQHFSMRGLRDHNNTLWCGYVLEGPGGRIYFAGDTGYGPHFAQIAGQFAPMRLALLPIGAYRPTWFMSSAHVSPAESVRAAQELGAATSVAIHFGTFALADDGEFEPVTDLQSALQMAPALAPRFWVLGFGEGRDVPADANTVQPGGAGNPC
ncbi:MAG: MBL fold metallo-hydrolase [Terriglobia bacterium]